jgi:hypothetical protein
MLTSASVADLQPCKLGVECLGILAVLERKRCTASERSWGSANNGCRKRDACNKCRKDEVGLGKS